MTTFSGGGSHLEAGPLGLHDVEGLEARAHAALSHGEGRHEVGVQGGDGGRHGVHPGAVMQHLSMGGSFLKKE